MGIQRSTPIPLNLAPDARVLFFQHGRRVADWILFGLAPAVQGTRVEPVHALKGQRARSAGQRSDWRGWSLKQMFVVSQVALSWFF